MAGPRPHKPTTAAPQAIAKSFTGHAKQRMHATCLIQVAFETRFIEIGENARRQFKLPSLNSWSLPRSDEARMRMACLHLAAYSCHQESLLIWRNNAS